VVDSRIMLSSLKSEWIGLRETFAGTRWRSHITTSPNARGFTRSTKVAAASRPALKGSAEEAGGVAERIQTD
jgi:hypothetical protein